MQTIADGAAGFEFDVMLTRDQQPVVVHTPFYSAQIGRMTWHQLQEMGVPHLREALEIVRTHDIVGILEPKRVSRELMEQIGKLISEYGVLKKIEIISFYSRRKNLEYIKLFLPDIRCSVIVLNPFTNWVKIANRLKADTVLTGWKGFNYLTSFTGVIQKRINELRASGIEFGVGIANDAKNIVWASALRPDQLFSDDVKLTIEIVDEHR